MSKKKASEEEQSLESTIMHEPWFKRLNELQSRWVPNTEENRSAYESLMNEIMIYVYMGCMQVAAKKYDEFACTDAMFWVMADLKNYNPALQSLGKYVSYHIHGRLKEAYSRIKEKNSVESSERSVWCDQVAELEKRFSMVSEDEHDRWVEEVHGTTYAEYWKQFERFTPERRRRILAAVKAAIAEYRPRELTLVDYMEKVLPDLVRQMLGISVSVEKKQMAKTPSKVAVSLVDIRDERYGAENIEDTNVDVGQELEQRDAAQTVILALVLNFAELKKHRRDNAVRHYRLFYTEQLTCSARLVSLPQQWGKDILEALHHPYFRYFIANADDDKGLTLQTVQCARPKKHGEVIPGKSMDEELPWDSEFFLPAKVQILYLQDKEQVRVSAATVSTRKREYQESLLSIRENQKE